MAEYFFPNGIGTLLLVLCSLAASAWGVRLQSSGTHMLVSAKEDSVFAHSAASRRQRRDATYPVASSPAVDVRQFHMKSTLYSRFATVTIDSEVVSRGNQSQEVTFQVQVPEVAFMSNFTMLVDGQLHVARVLEKAEAEKRFQEAKERNQTAGQVKQVPLKMERGMELFQIAINLAPGAGVKFTLVYNELLERRGGSYSQTLVVKPGAVVDNLTVTTSFAEPQGFTYFAYTLPGSTSKMTSGSVQNKTEMRASVNSKELVFRPSVEMQRQFDGEKGLHGMFTVHYTVNAQIQGGSILVQNEFFTHFFAPDDLDRLPKNILFVIDISGSMSGEKIRQASQAMLKILDDLGSSASDTFNLLLFDDKHEKWRESSVSASEEAIARAKDFVRLKLESRGGTDIHTALMTGLELLLGKDEGRSCDTANMIVFLTDGDPTSGIVDIDRIVRDVTARNNDRASIHSLGFGFNLNFDFLSALSLRNRGKVRRIYAEGDAQVQLQDFYADVSSPVLCDVVASYSSDVVSVDFLTLHDFPLYFQGQEIVVAGKTRLAKVTADYAQWDARVAGTGAQGSVTLVVPDGQVRVVARRPDLAEDLTERMWAYMKIKSLLRETQRLDAPADKARVHAQALNMSLTYGFVTPLTSFSIVVESVQGSRQMESMANARSAGQQACVGGGRWERLCCLLIGLLLLLPR